MKKIVKRFCVISGIVLFCFILLGLGVKKWHNDKYGKLVFAYDIKNSQRGKTHYEDDTVDLKVTRVEQRGRGGYIAIVFMDIKNKSNESNFLQTLWMSVNPAQYNPKQKKIELTRNPIEYTLDKRAYPKLVDPYKYVIKPGKTVKTYDVVLLDYPGQDLNYVFQESAFDIGPYKPVISLKTKG